MDLVPFNPDSYQNFASPAPRLQIISNVRESIDSSASASASSSPCSSDKYPHRIYTSEPSASVTDQILAAAPVLDWAPVLTEEWLRDCCINLGHSQSDRLSFYQFEPQTNRLLFPYGSIIYIGDVEEDGQVNPQPARAMDSAAGSSPNQSCSNLVHNALTAGLNMVSVSGPLTSPRASISSPAACNLDKGTGSSRAKADPRLGGSEMDLVAFTRDDDLWVMTMLGVETQLTFCSRNAKKSDISCGIAEFVMQEEFHRFTNYYWAPSKLKPKSTPQHSPSITPTTPPPLSTPPPLHQEASPPPPIASTRSYPTSARSSPPSSPASTSASETLPISTTIGEDPRVKERIVYLQVSEAMVDLVVIQRQGMHPEYEEYRYPHTGTPNAVSDLQIVEFIPKQHDEDIVPEPLHKRLWGNASLYKLFPWLEYIVRFGWMLDGESVWVQIVDRRQQITAIVAVPLECFMSVAEQSGSTEQMERDLASRIRVVYEEQSDYWINVTDILYFFSREDITSTSSEDDDDTIQLIVPSERTGYRQLYLATHSTRSGSTVMPITAGQYQIVDKPIAVDTSRQLVYFSAKRDSVLEPHLYVASYAKGAQPENVKRLTELGYSHQATVDVDKDRFLTLYSSVDQSPACAVLHLRWGDCRDAEQPSLSMGNGDLEKPWCPCGCQFPKISSHAFVLKEGIFNLSAKEIRRSPIWLYQFNIGIHSQPPTVHKSPTESKGVQSTSRFDHGVEHLCGNSDNVQLHGCLYRPANYVRGQKYPTLVSIYGGPRSQMVSNEYKLPKLLRVFLATRMGHTVVMIDGRGSNDRGLEFEGKLKHHMGQIEIRDQVEGLQFLARAENGGLVDMDRIAVSGWSYGAPVAQWELYNTAYTERYMGLIHDNKEDYARSSVLHWANKFPDDENRLLIAHGLIDENVHFKNTETLAAELIRHNKPHHVQVYPTERHGLRDARVNEHFETLMFYWLKNYLSINKKMTSIFQQQQPQSRSQQQHPPQQTSPLNAVLDPRKTAALIQSPPEATHLDLSKLLPRQRLPFPVVAFTLQDVLTPEECARLIERSEQVGYDVATVNVGSDKPEVLMPGYRDGKRCIIDDHQIVTELWERVKHHIPAVYQKRPVVGINERLRFLKYGPGGQFQPHMDGEYHRRDGSGQVTKITIQFYLNDGCEGGATTFLEQRMNWGSETSQERLPVLPKVGQVLIFQHDLTHEGSMVTQGEKYIIRSDILYGPPACGV
ncbi:dipeptidylpeptidase [Modicella reniformis]|uniref:Dipeptidylpeptidase n=1 Tax=Modicella reniformis TaxID=1440133 RepID=A0A9P6IL55_9FUNG|nr:dipeptidylpeptidase [Modicella reniformis]